MPRGFRGTRTRQARSRWQPRCAALFQTRVLGRLDSKLAGQYMTISLGTKATRVDCHLSFRRVNPHEGVLIIMRRRPSS